MSENSTSTASLLSTTTVRIILGFVVILVPLVFFAYQTYSQYTQSLQDSGAGAPFSVYIQNPLPYSTFEQGNQINISALASGPAPVKILELYVDGDLVESQTSPVAAGVLNFSADFLWTASELGDHNFYVRAISQYGAKSSPLLPIHIVEMGTAQSMNLPSPYVPTGPTVPVAQLGNGSGGNSYQDPSQENASQPPPPPPDPVDLQGAGQGNSLNVSMLSWISQYFGPLASLPAAPGLPATAVEGCRPRIWISDNSDNELGFHVYRRDPNLADFIKIATLDPYDGPVFTYDEDENKYGLYQYYVSAFSNAGESFSETVSVNVDSANCEPTSSPLLTLDLVSLFDETPTDMGYCYTSFDGNEWVRLPQAPQAFFNPSASNNQALSELVMTTADGMPTSGKAFCWAWQNGQLMPVGSWESDNLLELSELTEIVPYNEVNQSFTFAEWGDINLTRLPYDHRIPIPQVFLGAGPDVCADHVGDNFIFILVCADIADDLDYAFWNLGECPAETCFKASDIIGYNVYDTIYDNGESVAETQDHPVSLYFMLNETSCDPRHVWVTALVEQDGEILESYPSNTVFYNGNPNCGFLFGEEPRTYLLTLETIDFSVGNIDDGVDTEDDAEGYGHIFFRTYSNGENPYGSWNLEPINRFEFSDNDEDNPVQWRNMNLTYCTLSSLCYHWFTGPNVSVGAVNHTHEFELFIGEGGKLFLHLTDDDGDLGPSPDDDLICEPGWFYFDTYDVDAAPNQVLNVTQSASHSDASCEFKFRIELIQ